MSNLESQPAEIRFTIEVKRAATGVTETVEMVGVIQGDPSPEPTPEIEGAPI